MRPTLIAASLLAALALPHAVRTADATPAAKRSVTASRVYIVAFDAEPLAAFRGGIVQGKHYAATSPAATGARKLDVAKSESRAYLAQLDRQHAAFLAAASRQLGRAVAAKFDYTVALNGMAIELADDEAAALRALPGVVAVTPERIDRVLTDAGPAWIGAEAVWNGTVPGSNARTRGEGAVVGVIDTGINAAHPSFADVGGDGYNHVNPRGRMFGFCETTPARCSDKLIGIRDFTTEGARDGTDTDGHGSHVASTAAGNVVDSQITTMTGTIALRVSGVAPHANVISYKACVEGEGDEPGSCPQSATLAAINQAVVDQVDVINYSIGGDPRDPWNAVRSNGSDDASAFLNARFAGVVPVVAAGNDGPGAGTVASPSNAPWVIAVSNVSHDRQFRNAASNVTGTGIATPLRFDGQSLTGVPVTANVVDAATRGFPLCSQGDAIDFPPTGASNPFPPGTFNGEIVLCRRGTTGRVTKGFNVRAAGAGGMILYNTAAEGESTVPDDHHLPATHIGARAGAEFVALLAAARTQGGSVRATITATQGVRTGRGDLLSGSSGRGPVEPTGGWLKPNVAAPGSGILAAARTGTGLATLSGTSMASPHVAGAAALLASANPGWTVAQIESALLTTGTDGVVLPDAVTRATPHDAGAGRTNVADAARAGLWFDVTREQFVAADPSSNSGLPEARDPSRLNLPSLESRACLDGCSFTRTVTAFAAGSWRAAPSSVPGISVAVSPAEFTLAAGQSQALQLTISITDSQRIGQWSYGRVELVPSGTAPGPARTQIPYAVKADPGTLPQEIRISADTTNGFRDIAIPGLGSLRNPRFDTGPLARLAGQSQGLPADPTRDDPYDLPSAGVFVKFIDVPAGAAAAGYGLYVEASSATARDVDLYVGLDANGDGQVQESEERCVGGSSGATERCAVAFAGESTRRAWILVQNFSASASGATDIVTLRDGAVALKSTTAAPKLAVTAPGRTQQGQPFAARVSWNEPRMMQGEAWIGFAGLGFGAGAIAHTPVVLQRANNLVAPIVMHTGAAGRDSEDIALAPGNAHDRIVIDVPPTATAMTVTTSGEGEVDLYVARAPAASTDPVPGTAPARGLAQGTSIRPGASERVDLAGAALTPGRWFLTPVNAGTTDARFTLEVALTESGIAPAIGDNGYFNEARAGHGVFFHQIGDLWAVVWYTYLQDNTPAWYIATGPRPAAGRGAWSAPLLRFTWDGSVSASTVVGEAAITTTAPNRFAFTWVVDGVWGSEPFAPTGVLSCANVNGSNLSVAGSWFAPSRSGYGFNIVTTPTTEAMTTYVYDDAGNPRWLLGSIGTPGRGTVPLTQFAGFCPTCTFNAIRPSDAGTLTRGYTSATSGNATLAINFPSPVAGSWNTNDAIQKITATFPCTP